MEPADRGAALALLRSFLREDPNYAAHRAAYGDWGGGDENLAAALTLFLEKPQFGFVWLTFEHGRVVACATVCYGISTSIGAVVARVFDFVVEPGQRGRGIGHAALESLGDELRGRGVARMDLGVHDGNERARRFYLRRGFNDLHERGLALIL